MRNLELTGRSPVHAPGRIDNPPLLVLAKNQGFRCILFRDQGLCRQGPVYGRGTQDLPVLPGVGRAFCDQCGTPLTIESEKGNPRTIEFHISTFDNPDDYVPSLHWYHSRRIAWSDVADSLPRYDGLDGDGKEPSRHGPATEGPPAGTER